MSNPLKSLNESRIAVIGLGYVGLPLAVEFGRFYPTVGFDINSDRVEELSKGVDTTLEIEKDYLKSVLISSKVITDETKGLSVTTAVSYLEDCNIYVVKSEAAVRVGE